MTQEPTDPRVQRTRKLLKDALVELSSERGFDAVTVGDIVQHAKVNRATFYRHYQDKYALVEEIFQEAIDRLRRDLKPPNEEALDLALQNPPERLVKLFEHFAEHKHLYRVLLGGNGSSWFAARMRDQFTQFLEQREQYLIQLHPKEKDKDESSIPKRVEFTLVSNVLLSTVTWWLENGKEYSPKQMASWFVEFAIRGHVRVLGP